jgi:hypothetical protein
MNIISRRAARRGRAALVTAAVAGAGLAGALAIGGAANASVANPNGWVVYTSCTGVSGSISISPGLHALKARNVQEVLTGTTSGCSNIFDGSLSGTGTLTAVMSGSATYKAQNLSGTFTINWPASSGYNPSNGTLTATESNGVETVTGSVTSGFETGAEFGLQYVITGHTGKPRSTKGVIAETYTNTQPLTLSVNTG